jgi:diadenosine tetraphosphatase ApaH/serine/threonine PP2A family protein phosphatase
MAPITFLVQRSTDRHRSEVLCTHGGQPNELVQSPSETDTRDRYGRSRHKADIEKKPIQFGVDPTLVSPAAICDQVSRLTVLQCNYSTLNNLYR